MAKVRGTMPRSALRPNLHRIFASFASSLLLNAKISFLGLQFSYELIEIAMLPIETTKSTATAVINPYFQLMQEMIIEHKGLDP